MLRSSLNLLIAAVAAGLGTGTAQAGGCTDLCGPVTVEAVSVPMSAPFYVVDQGPVYYGPGITRGPTYFEVLTPSHRFLYVGGSYYWAVPVADRSYAGPPARAASADPLMKIPKSAGMLLTPAD